MSTPSRTEKQARIDAKNIEFLYDQLKAYNRAVKEALTKYGKVQKQTDLHPATRDELLRQYKQYAVGYEVIGAHILLLMAEIKQGKPRYTRLITAKDLQYPDKNPYHSFKTREDISAIARALQ